MRIARDAGDSTLRRLRSVDGNVNTCTSSCSQESRFPRLQPDTSLRDQRERDRDRDRDQDRDQDRDREQDRDQDRDRDRDRDRDQDRDRDRDQGCGSQSCLVESTTLQFLKISHISRGHGEKRGPAEVQSRKSDYK
ncbi:hypothetical protein F2P81_016582 [Scophthalmus maximus]|uniref:Uncharacterized protein n=1 Tax=Scophthalmus maximus TaxID=52904 RepID=A0A6A4SFJ9_SCOMX|nr:hypothetical protein F2P81_016582 [Scophthalmus maximus]